MKENRSKRFLVDFSRNQSAPKNGDDDFLVAHEGMHRLLGDETSPEFSCFGAEESRISERVPIASSLACPLPDTLAHSLLSDQAKNETVDDPPVAGWARRAGVAGRGRAGLVTCVARAGLAGRAIPETAFFGFQVTTRPERSRQRPKPVPVPRRGLRLVN